MQIYAFVLFGGWNGALGNSGFTALTLFQSSLFGGFGRRSEIGAIPARYRWGRRGTGGRCGDFLLAFFLLFICFLLGRVDFLIFFWKFAVECLTLLLMVIGVLENVEIFLDEGGND